MSESESGVNYAPSLLTKEQAEGVSELTPQGVAAIIKLASLGMRPDAIVQYATAILGDERPPLPAPSTSAKPLTILAWSFVKDRGQYGGAYGLTGSEAGALADLLLTDPTSAAKKITEVVTKRLRERKSPRPVHVSLEGLPSQASAGVARPPSSDGGLSALRVEIRSNSGVYGSYHFDARATGRPAGHAYAVRLGGNLHVLAQSKALCVAAARVVRVKGRSDPLVANLVCQWDEVGTPKFGSDISEKVGDGRLGPNDPIPGDAPKKAKTTLTTST